MTKRTIVIIVVVVAVMGVIGLAMPSEQNDKESNVKQTTSMPSSQVSVYAEKLGATDRTEAYYTMVGARDGAKYQLNGKTVEIYDFDRNKVVDGLKHLSNDGVEVRRVENTIFVFHDYPEDSTEVDNLMKRVQ